MATIDQAIAAVRARLDAAGLPFPVYYHGDTPPELAAVASPFAFIVFNNEGSSVTAYGGGRGKNLYRNRARVEAFVFSPAWYGMEMTASRAEMVAAQLRSYRDDVISCFEADVIPVGQGSSLSVPGLVSEVSNYNAAIVEAVLMFDQIG
jgi:hypothetical protein